MKNKKLERLKSIPRENLKKFSELPNVGAAMTADLELLGLKTPQDLTGQDPYLLFERMCKLRGPQDPCVLDTYISVVRFMNGEPPLTWWSFTEERKLELQRRRKEKIGESD